MTIEERLRILTSTPADLRPALLAEWLPEARHQTYPFRRGNKELVENFVLEVAHPRLIIGAHHDIDPGTSQGALDNAAAVVTLIHLADRLRERVDTPDVEIAFWDLEEPGNGGFATGSKYYVRELKERGVEPELAIVCDVLGLGKPIVSSRGGRGSLVLTEAMMYAGEPCLIEPTPASDDISFSREGFTVSLLASVHPTLGREPWYAMHSEDDTIDLIDIPSLYTLVDRLEHIAVAMHQEREEIPWRAPDFGEFPYIAPRPRRRRQADKNQLGLGL